MRRKLSSTHLRAPHWSDCGPLRGEAPKLRFVILSRLSDDEQAKGADTSLDAQERLCRAAVERHIAQHGGELVRCVRGDKTGTTLKRPDWKEILELAEARAFDVLVAVRMDRVARGKVFNVAEHLLTEEKVAVWLTEDSFSADAGGQTMKQVYVLRDGMYPLFVSQAVKSHQVDAVAEGYWPGGRAPFGVHTIIAPGMADTPLSGGKIKLAPRVPRAHPEEAPIVAEAYRLMALYDNMGEVQRYLRRAAPDRAWNIDSVKRLLTHEIYQGTISWGPNSNSNVRGFDAIVPLQLWQKVQGIIETRKAEIHPANTVQEATPKRARASKCADGSVYPYYLRERVRCGHCGCLMTPAPHRGRTHLVHYYECTRLKLGHKACPVKRINAGALHESVLAEIARCGAHPTRLQLMIAETVRQMPSEGARKGELALLKRNRRETAKKLQRLVEALKSGLPARTIASEMRELEELACQQEEAIATLEAVVSSLSGQRPNAAQVSALWASFSELWEDATEEERHRLLRLIVEKVEVQGVDPEDKKKTKGNLYLILEIPPSTGCVLDATTVRDAQERTNAPQQPIEFFIRGRVSPASCVTPLSIPRNGRRSLRGRQNVPV